MTIRTFEKGFIIYRLGYKMINKKDLLKFKDLCI